MKKLVGLVIAVVLVANSGNLASVQAQGSEEQENTSLSASAENIPPRFKSNNYTVKLGENRGRGWQTPKGKLNAHDPDGDDAAITYAIIAGNPECWKCGMKKNPYRHSLFRVANNARITYQGSGEDYEAFPEGEAFYSLILEATDERGGSVATYVTVEIVDRPDTIPEVPKPMVLSATIAEIPGNLPDYDRDDWKHWMDEDKDCQDTRQEVLVAESIIAVTFKTDKNCKVETGKWNAPYTGKIVTSASSLDIDHMVPLKNAHDSGGWGWSAEKKKRYANYLDDPQHLIGVAASANRSKGSKGPEAWKPAMQSYWCQYAIDWVVIKDTWELTVTASEVSALREMLDTCSMPVTLATAEVENSEEPPPPSVVVYASCEDAEAAGEERILGSKGSGKGFPKEMVPSARDGDGDGVVCEK